MKNKEQKLKKKKNAYTSQEKNWEQIPKILSGKN